MCILAGGRHLQVWPGVSPQCAQGTESKKELDVCMALKGGSRSDIFKRGQYCENGEVTYLWRSEGYAVVRTGWHGLTEENKKMVRTGSHGPPACFYSNVWKIPVPYQQDI